MEPHNHRANASERAIKNFKNNFISGLYIRDPNFPTVLRSYLLRQAQDSLNMLHTSRLYPKISTYHVLECIHNFNRHPWTSTETKGTIFNPPETRFSWGSRTLDLWYLHPAWKNYICLTFVDTATGGINIYVQYTLYPQHCKIPIKRSMDEERNIASGLVQAIKKHAKSDMSPSGPTCKGT